MIASDMNQSIHFDPFQEFLRDKTKVQKLGQYVDPLVRAIDGIAGERVSMRVSFTCVKSGIRLLMTVA
jgi:hypothetical protein